MLLSAVWLLAATAAFLSLWHETDEVLDSALTEIAQRLLLLPDAALDVPDTADDLATIGLHREFVVYQVFDQQKSLQLRSHDAPATPLDAGAPDGLRRAGDWWVLALTAANGSRRAQVAEALAHRHEVLWDRLVWLLGVLLAMLPLAALGGGWLLRRGFAVLEPARLALARRTQHDLRARPVATAPAELQPGLDTVNDVLTRVRRMVEGERAFAANIAHELRTPLAAAMAQAQRLVQASTDPATREPAQALLRQLDRLTRLATRLLQLARIESGVALQHAAVDLVQLTLRVADDFTEAQRNGRLLLQVDVQPLPVQGDIDALGIALRNLFDNALRHGGDAARVTVHIDGQCLRVVDDGPGVAANRVVGLVRKFVRGNGTVVSGSGLRLSLVEPIAQQSGARLVLQSPLADGHGFSASLCFDVDPGQRPANSVAAAPP